MTAFFEIAGIPGEVEGSGQPVVLLHGLGSSRRTWDLLLPYLTPDFSITRLDLPGHGAARERTTTDDFTSLRADLRAIFSHLDLTGPVVVGHSWGASVALDLAAHDPELVSKLILVDGGYMDFRQVPGMTWNRLEQELAPPRIDLSTSDFTAAMRRGLGHHWRPEFDPIFKAHMQEQDGRVYPRLPYDDHVALLRGMWDHNPTALYPHVEAPTLLLTASFPGPGSLDWETLRTHAIDQMEDLVPRLQVVHMRDTLHDIPMHRPEQLASAMRDFIGSSRASGA